MASSSSTCFSSLSPSPSLSSSRHHLLPSRRASFPFRFPKKRTQQGFRAFGPPNPPHAAPNIHSRIHSRREIKATPVTKDQWENLILNSETPVLVEFYASWCGPCRMVHRIIDEIAAEYDGRLKCFVLNTDTDMPIAEDYEIKAVPVVLLFKNGQKCDNVIGTMPKEFYVAAVERVLKS